MNNAFYFGDNLHVLREYIADESVDLVYLDPPFNSKSTYNLLFPSPDRSRWTDSQIATFEDSWKWGPIAEAQYEELLHGRGRGGETVAALFSLLRESDMMAYLTMMTARLVELHRVLKPTGSLYLHCDPNVSHYLKVVLDRVFGPGAYRTEISWRRQSAHNDGAQGRRQYGNVRDVLLFFSKSSKWTWHEQHTPYDDSYVEGTYAFTEAESGRRFGSFDITAPGGGDPKKRNPHYEFLGITRYWRFSRERMQELYDQGRIFQVRPGAVPRQKRYLDEMPGVSLQNDWGDIRPLSGASREKLGYPTQKPVALLERIINVASNPGDVILDPFCGCGTTLHAAEKVGHRRWIGIDVAVQSMKIVSDRLRANFPGVAFDVFGIPTTTDGARWLAGHDPYKFEEWAVSWLGGTHSGRRRADGGIDGMFYFLTDNKNSNSRGIISVKGGQSLNPSMVRDLAGTLQRERTLTRDGKAVAVLICAWPPTKGMIEEARRAGVIETDFGQYPALQVLSIDEVFKGASIRVPFIYDSISGAAAGRRRGTTASGYVDPAELARQRHMLFTFYGQKQPSKTVTEQPELPMLMPAPARRAG